MNEAPESGFNRREEVERLLEQDETVLGRFWRYEQEGLSPEQMQAAEGTETAGWTYNYRSILGVIRDGEIPSAPSSALQGARRISLIGEADRAARGSDSVENLPGRRVTLGVRSRDFEAG